MNFVSTGGIGDFFIVYLKIQEYIKKNPDELIDWLHAESADISKPIKELLDIFDIKSKNLHFGFDYDKDYIRNIKDIIRDREIIPTPVQGRCDFYKKEWPLNDCFLENSKQEKDYDIVLQVAGGVGNNRRWKDSPFQIAKVLSSLGRHVTLVGTDEAWKGRSNEPDKVLNLVGRTTFSDVFAIIEKSSLFIGLSGVLNYFACASKIPNIHLIESPQHEISYYHSEWQNFTKGIAAPTLTQIISVIRFFENGDRI